MTDQTNMETTAVEMPEEGQAHFGFKSVAEDAKSGLVKGVFRSVADRYDVMNDVMSGGLHRLWKASLIDELKPRAGMHLLDVAGGTGDIAFRFLDTVTTGRPGTTIPGKVTIVDMNDAMLEVGRRRAIDRGHTADIEWVCGDAEDLPLGDRSVDAYTIAFGIRNVTHIEKALAEACRVLKPGGRFLCLEFSKAAIPGLQRPYDWYSFNVIPAIGGRVAGNRESYQYLVESIRRFPPQEDFRDMIEAAGFRRTRYRNMAGGIVALHSAWRI